MKRVINIVFGFVGTLMLGLAGLFLLPAAILVILFLDRIDEENILVSVGFVSACTGLTIFWILFMVDKLCYLPGVSC